jgi:hypothetical protein
MLPAQFDPTGSYSDRQFDRARGFRLLAHAEIEACIEDLATSTATAAYSSWFIDRQPRQCLLALLAYYEGALFKMPSEISTNRASESPLRVRVKAAKDHYVNWATSQNHGIREENILRLLLPVGILESDLDPAWLQLVDAFGTDRGATAHQARRTQHPPDPATELQTVRGIARGLRTIDERLSALAA